ncbi:PREDICTED: ankyrin-2-like [Wasmannia auropunctata]|uniref:ankyrin-2-like n=1 Tax=Wasmannia auropunctata TaxID=64793 RepID=UPI0005EFDE38|nr:PREDICTED: ankyrin-2-like [Wasmannia auropunctata]
MLKELPPVQSQSSPECELDQLEKLKCAAELHISYSKIYLRMLRRMLQVLHPYDSEKNTSPWNTLKEGSYYLGNAYSLVQIYKDCVLGSIDNKSIQSVNDMLVTLEFDRKHITYGYTDEAYGGETKCFVSKGQGTKYYELLHSELKKDVRSFIEMVELNIDIPVQRFLESIKQRLQSFSEKLLEAMENDNLLAVENCIKRGVVVNFKDTDGRTSLHYAVNNGNIDIVSILLKNGAEVTEITNKSNTPLHIASSKGFKEVVEVLLQYVNRDKVNGFIDAKTASDDTTSLHVAAKNGFLEVVKSLLQHGATYNIENKEGKTPINLSKNQKVANFLKLVEELFEDTKKGNVEIINKLKAVKQDEFLAVTRALNNQGNTLLQVAVSNGHKNVASKLLEMLNDPVQLQFSPECKLAQLESLKCAAELHIHFSEHCLPSLLSMSQSYGSKKNTRWKTLKKGSYYLLHAHHLVQLYNCVSGSIDNKSIQSINNVLVTLEFDPKHITRGYTDEAYGGKAECFVSKGQGTKYYELLHSELKKDVISFIGMVEIDIDSSVKMFLKSINQRLQFAFSSVKNLQDINIESEVKSLKL